MDHGIVTIYPKEEEIEAFGLDPTSHSIFIINSDTLYKSMDDGLNWKSVGVPFKHSEAFYRKSRVSSFAMATNGEMIVGVEDPKVNKIFEFDTTARWLGAFSIAGFGLLPGMIYRSFDGGRNWSPSPKGLPPLCGEFEFSSDGAILVGTHRGLYSSEDSGYTWKSFNEGLLRKNAVYMCNIGADIDRTVCSIKAAKNGNVYVIKGGMLFLSTSMGKSWMSNHVDVEWLSNILITDDDRMVGSSSVGVFLSPDLGKSWTPFSAGLTSVNIRDIEIDTDGYLFSVSEDGRVFKTLKPLAASH